MQTESTALSKKWFVAIAESRLKINKIEENVEKAAGQDAEEKKQQDFIAEVSNIWNYGTILIDDITLTEY